MMLSVTLTSSKSHQLFQVFIEAYQPIQPQGKHLIQLFTGLKHIFTSIR